MTLVQIESNGVIDANAYIANENADWIYRSVSTFQRDYQYAASRLINRRAPAAAVASRGRGVRRCPA